MYCKCDFWQGFQTERFLREFALSLIYTSTGFRYLSFSRLINFHLVIFIIFSIIYQFSLICFFLSKTVELASGWDFFGIPGIRDRDFLFRARSKIPKSRGSGSAFVNPEKLPSEKLRKSKNPRRFGIFWVSGCLSPGFGIFLVSRFSFPVFGILIPGIRDF